MTAELPPRQRLLQVVQSLAHHLPGTFDTLLAHPRFAAAAGTLVRFRDEAVASTAVAAVAEDEAAWLAELLLERWRLIGEPVLDPVVAIIAPAEIWIGVEPVRITIEAVVVGSEAGWEVIWDGATPIGAARAAIVIAPGTDSVACRVHARARTASGRVALTSGIRIPVRKPIVTVRDDLRRIVVTDQHDVPAVGVRLAIGDVEHVTGPGGLVELVEPAPRGATLRVQGIASGRIPNEHGDRT